MTKKKSSFSVRQVFLFGSKLVFSLSIILCVFAFFTLNSYSQLQSSLASIVLRSRTLEETQLFDAPPKIAFLFLARKDLPLDFLWGTFFQNADVANFSIYIHSEPGFVFDEFTSRSSIFYGRQLRKSIQVVWGESSMIEAERLLLGEALKDPANQRFVLLSDGCVPLYNFSYIYNYLMTSPRSFVDSFLDVFKGGHDDRYNPKMSPVIPKDKWRKGSQWIVLIRRHAYVVVEEGIILPVFKRYCKRRPPIDPSLGYKENVRLQRQHNCIPDEHYVQTLLAMSELEDELERRTLTFTMWNQSDWHPVTFSFASASPQKLKEIKAINHVYYKSEYRTEWCKTNSTFVSCFLFARKFSKAAAMRLLSEGVVGNISSAAVLNTAS